MSVLLAKPYNQYQSYKAGEYITFNGSSNYYIALEDTGKQQSPTTANRKWQQVFNAGALTPSGVVAGTYGDATNVGQFTVDINGIVTNAVDVPITAGVPALTNTHIFVGNAGNVATDVAMSGDATVANTGALTIANNAVTYAKMQSVSTTSRLLGSSSTTTPVQEITLGTNLSLSGTTLNVTGGSGTVTSVNAGTNISVTGTATDPIINSLSDRYKTSSTTSNSVSNGSKSFTVDLNLSYIPLQEILVVYDAANHMHGEVTSYNSATGALVVDIKNHTGSGTYTSWVLNLDGTPVDALSGSGTINEIAYFTGAQILSSLAVATYPSLTELAYVKGVTSDIQTQINTKQATISLTTTGTSGAATFAANVLNVPIYSTGTAIVLSKTVTDVNVNATAETKVYSYTVAANTLAAGDILDLIARFRKTGTAGTMITRIRFGTNNSTADTLIAQMTSATGTLIQNMQRTFLVKDATHIEAFQAASNVNTDDASSGSAVTSVTVNLAVTNYFVVTIQDSSAVDTGIFSGWYLRKN